MTLHLNLEGNKEEVGYRISLLNGHTVECSVLYKDVPIIIEERVFPGDLIQFYLSEFHIILGMNLLTTHGVNIAREALKIILKKKDGILRLYINYKELNTITIKSKYPLPQIDDSYSGLEYF